MMTLKKIIFFFFQKRDKGSSAKINVLKMYPRKMRIRKFASNQKLENYGFISRQKSIPAAKRASLFVVILFMLNKAEAGGAPSLGGVPGLVRIPTADFMQDGSIYGGVNLIPRQSLPYSHFNNDGLVTFVSVTFLPFIEFDLRLTKQLGRPPSQHHTVDRSPSIRLKLLRDKGMVPAFVLGFHDLFSTVEKGEARHFGSTYIVASKILKIKNILFAPTFGYGLNVIKARRHEFVGFFGGVKLQLFSQQQYALCLEYDSTTFNIGADASLLNLITLKCAFLDLRYFSFGAGMHFDLFDVF